MPKNTGLPLFEAVNDVALAAFGETEGFDWRSQSNVLGEGLQGIFDARHYSAEVDGEVGISEYSPALTCRRADVNYGEPGGIAVDHVITLRETDYRVKDMRPDSEGMVVIVLVEDS
jgi:hypothetical protein